MKKAFVFAAVSIILTGIAGFAQESSEKRFVATVGQDGVQRVEITGGNYYFDPNVVVVKVNVPVEFVVKKVGGTPHNIILKAPEAGIDFKESMSKDSKTIKFTATKTGKYPFWCGEQPPFGKSHKDRGMQGVLEVVD